MSDCHNEFQDFLAELDLLDGQEDRLRQSRDALRDKIAEYFRSQRKSPLPRNAWQGSFALKTQNRPISEDFDLDDGVYLRHFSDSTDPLVSD